MLMNSVGSIPELKGKGLFVFSDPGGAKPLLSYVTLNGLERTATIFSDRTYDFYKDFPVVVRFFPAKADIRLQIKKLNPDYVFTGTSYTSDIELRFLDEANKVGIPSYSFVDHYTQFAERFRWKGESVMPDRICVIDEEAARIAKLNGITTPLLVTGNFYHTFLEGWKPMVNKAAFFKELGIPQENKLLVFAPDPLSNVGTKDYFGFDEVVVWQQIALNLSKLNNQRLTVVVNMHPNQNNKYLIANLGKHDFQVIVENRIHTNTLLYFSDIVMGMFSSILIEAMIMKKRVIRYMVGFNKEDPFASRVVGEVAYNYKELEQIFSTI